MAEKYARLVGKYALLLAFLYLAETIAWSYFNEFIMDTDGSRRFQGLLDFAPYLFSYVLNFVVVFTLAFDKKRLGIPTRYVYISTILFRPIGVCAFLLYALFESKKLTVEQPL